MDKKTSKIYLIIDENSSFPYYMTIYHKYNKQKGGKVSSSICFKDLTRREEYIERLKNIDRNINNVE